MYAQIDRYEEDLVVFVFDDEQQLVLPRSILPAAARPGTTVRAGFTPAEPYAMLGQDVLSNAPAGALEGLEERARWAVPVQVEQLAGEEAALTVTLADGQRLVLRDIPASALGPEPSQRGWLVFEVDPEETARRRAHVQALVRRLFGTEAVE
jgi:hypothetical protein